MIRAKANTSNRIVIPVVLITLVTLFFPYVNVIFLFFPIQLLGKNFWLVAPMLVMLTLYLSTLFGKGRAVKRSDVILFFIAIVVGFINLSRDVLYTEPGSFLDVRYIFSPIIFILVFKRLVHGEKNANLLRVVLFTTCFIQAILGILHAHFFSELNISFDPDSDQIAQIIFDAKRTREGGTLGASIYANIIVCGMFLLIPLNDKLSSYRASILLIISALVMIYAISLSGSRYPMIVSGLIALVFFARFFLNARRRLAMLFILITLALLLYLSIGDFEFFSIVRLDEGSGGRWGKFVLPLVLVSQNILHLFIGVPDVIVTSSFTTDGYLMSDNSYMQILTRFGLFFISVYLICLIGILRQNIVDKLSLYFFIYFLVGLGLTNCILWEPWIFFAMLTLTILYQNKSVNVSATSVCA